MRRLLALLSVAAFLAPPAALFANAAAEATSPSPQSSVTVALSAVLPFAGRIAQVAYSPDGLHLAVAVAGGPIAVLNATTLVGELNLSTPAAWISVSSLSWSPASDKVGVGYEAGVAAVWRVPSGSSAWAKSGLGYDVKGVAWSPDGKFLAAGIVHSIFIFWGEDGYLNATLSLDYGGSQPAGLSWSHDSDFIAVGQQAYSPMGAILALFDSTAWSKSLGWRWFGPAMDNVAFEGRARFLAVQLGESRVEVWEVRNWTLFANLTSASGLEQFAWTADGSRLVTLETEPSTAPNQTEDYGGFEVLHLGGGANNSTALSVAPDGQAIAVGYADGSVAILSASGGAGGRCYADATPLEGTTGDPLTFDVHTTTALTDLDVWFASADGGNRSWRSMLPYENGTPSRGWRATLNIPSNWSGPLYYWFDHAGIIGVCPATRLVRIFDNDAPAVLSWNFTRQGAAGETAAATITVRDNIGLVGAAFQMSVDGAGVASASGGGSTTLTFALGAPLAPSNRSVRLDLTAFDAAGNGGSIFQMLIPLDDLTPPTFGWDLSQAGTAGGRIQLGTVASDERGPPTVTLTWRELTENGETPWSNFTYGQPSPGTSSYSTTFPLGRATVAVEYYFEAVDAAGNTNATATRVQPVADREPPEIVIDLSDREAFEGRDFHLAVVVRDNIGVPSVVAYFQQDGGASTPLNLTPWQAYGGGAFEGHLPVGTDTLQVAYSFFVTDLEGNTVSSGTRTLRVGDRTPPRIWIVGPALRVTAGSDLTLDVEVADRSGVGNLTVYYKREGEASFLEQEFRPDAVAVASNITTARFSVSLDALGIQTMRDGRAVLLYFFALDGALNSGTLGSAGDPVRIAVLDGAPPTARIATAGDLVEGSLISFDGSASDDDIGVVSFAWFVDGLEVGNRSALAWRFESTGEHTVKLVVRDASNNTAQQTQSMAIQPPAAQTAGVGAASVAVLVAAAAAGAALAVWLVLSRRNKGEGS